jgi:hypothetical protein
VKKGDKVQWFYGTEKRVGRVVSRSRSGLLWIERQGGRMISIYEKEVEPYTEDERDQATD